MMTLKQKIINLSDKLFPQVVDIRRHLHQYPELSFQEVETAQYISNLLTKWGIEFESGIAETGIVAYIRGKNPEQKTVALRADMDALPIEEKNNVSYQSKNKGVMHACGHDAHTASLLGTILILNSLKDEFEGTIKCIFQPGEELLPGGAKRMIQQGVLKNPEPEIVIGQHVYPELPAGKIGLKDGPYMASTDEIYITIKGRGGHGAMPWKIDDTVLIASHIILALQQISSRHAPDGIPTILSFGKIIANGATNVIPDEVYLEGTFRTMNEEWRTAAHRKIKKITTGVAQSMGAKAEINIKKGYPVLINDAKITRIAKKAAMDYLGKNNVMDLNYRMTAEDFAYFAREKPSVFYRLGVSAINQKECSSLHSSTFDINEKALNTGMGTMAYLAIQFLKP
ncbi:MAG: M20 family metallopeptidase [Bacteroidales bacterium]|jgi:amidohydrolase|nr:M20 family metallopeptidase [Bacteroidales bacterium]